MKTIKKWQDVPRSEAGWANWPALMQREIDELRQALAQPESEPSCRVCGSPIGSLHMAAGNLKCGWPARVQASDCESSDRAGLIAQHRARAESAKLRGPNYSPCISADELLKLLDMLEADALNNDLMLAWQKGFAVGRRAQQVTVPQELVPVAKRDTLRTRLNIIMGQINQLEWKTGVGGSYFETVQEQCDAIVKDFGLKRLSSHLMSLPHTWVRRNTGLTDGYEIIEPRGCYVPANQAQQVAVPPTWDDKSEAMLHLNTLESMLGGANGPTIRLRVLLQAAPQPAYVPLSDAEIDAIWRKTLVDNQQEICRVTRVGKWFARAIEARHSTKEKS